MCQICYPLEIKLVLLSLLLLSRSVRIKTSKLSEPSTPATLATSSAQVKKGLTPPDFPIDHTKNKPCLSPMSSTEEAVHIKVTTGDSSYSKYNITLAETEIAQIYIASKESFKAGMATLVKGIVD